MKQYELLKDLPGVEAGTIFTEQDCKNTIWLNNYYSNGGILLQKENVEHNPDWFELLK